jgi:hypothetical protein
MLRLQTRRMENHHPQAELLIRLLKMIGKDKESS